MCSTLSPASTLTHESMSTHVPNSPFVCIHSVCVSKPFRHRGVALALLREYVNRLEKSIKESNAKYRCVLLITHEELRGFYEKAGFDWLGPSTVKHGSRMWFEMRRDLTLPSPLSGKGQVETPEQTIEGQASLPFNILEVLRQREDGLSAGRLISDFHHGLSDLLEVDESHPGNPVNRYDLLCPRSQCGSLILKKGVGKWVERESVQARIFST